VQVACVLGLCTAATLANAEVPSAAALQELVDRVHEDIRGINAGANADYIPALAEVDSSLFGIAIVTADGEVVTAGDVDYSFAIESVSKPFTMALVLHEIGLDALIEKIGVEPTGMPFNSVVAVEVEPARSVNPLVNAGAMAAVSLLEASDADTRWQKILDGYEAFAGEDLALLDQVYESEAATNYHNRGIANLLFSYERLYADPDEVVDVYTKQCSVGVTAVQLATMGATLANGGVNPRTGERLLAADLVPRALAIMLTAGFYDESGRWSVEAGLPSKTGVGGGIVSVVPGQMAIAAFSPPLDEAGNSVRAQRAISRISDELGLSIFKAHGSN
jgi:glutaminase